MLFILAVVLTGLSLIYLYLNIPEIEYVGTNAQKVLNTHELKESTFNFLDTSFMFALNRAKIDVLKKGGFNTLEFEGTFSDEPFCGSFEYPVLSNTSCFNEEIFEHILERSIQLTDSLKLSHPLTTSVDLSYRTELKDDEVVYRIRSTLPVRIPLYDDISSYSEPDPYYVDAGSVFLYEDLLSNEIEARTGFNYASRGSAEVDVVVFHYTGGSTLQGALDTLLINGFSYHYIIDKDGRVVNLVPEEMRAHHAGCRDRQNPDRGVCKPGFNSRSIGISFVNRGYLGDDVELHGKTWEIYTEEQYQNGAKLLAAIAKRHEGIELIREHMYSHGRYVGAPADYNYIDSTGSKEDPGPAFDYDKILALANEYYNQAQEVGVSLTAQGFDSVSSSYAEIFSNSPTCPVPDSVKLERVAHFANLINEVEQQNSIPTGTIAGIIMHESCAHPLTLNNYPRVGDGGVGLGQFMAGTAKEHGMNNIYEDRVDTTGNTQYGENLLNLIKSNNYRLDVLASVDDRFNPEKSIRGIGDYLKKSYEQLNNWDLAILSYWKGRTGAANSNLPLSGEDLRYVNNVKRNQNLYSGTELIVQNHPSRFARQIRATLGVLSQDYSFSTRFKKTDLDIYFETKERIRQVNLNCGNLDYESKKECVENIMLEPKDDIFYEKHCIPRAFEYQSFSNFDEEKHSRFLGFVVATHNEKIIDDLNVNLASGEFLLKTFEEEYFILSYEDDVADEEKLLFSIRDVLEIEGVPPQSDLREEFNQVLLSKDALNKVKLSSEGYSFVASDIKRQLNDCYNTQIDCNCNVTPIISGIDITFSENLNLPFQVLSNEQTEFTINSEESIYFTKTQEGLQLVETFTDIPNFCEPEKITYMMCAKQTPDQEELTITNNKIFPFTLII